MPKPPRPKGYSIDVGSRLLAARLALNLSAKDICEAINVQQNTYSQWENGKNVMDVVAATRLKARFGIPLDWIYAGDPAGLPMQLANQVLQAK